LLVVLEVEEKPLVVEVLEVTGAQSWAKVLEVEQVLRRGFL
jgi:hypothetical protein